MIRGELSLTHAARIMEKKYLNKVIIPFLLCSATLSLHACGVQIRPGAAQISQNAISSKTLLSIQITPPLQSISAGSEISYTATGIFSDNTFSDLTQLVIWNSSDVALAVGVSKNNFSGVNQGTVQITASFNGITTATPLRITSAVLTSLAITPPHPTLPLGGVINFVATGTYSDGSTQNLTTQVSWSSGDGAVFTVSNGSGTKGNSTSVSTGLSYVSASLGGVTTSTPVTVTAATLSTISITPSNPSVALGIGENFIATGNYSDGTTQDISSAVSWSSSNPGIATISNGSGTHGNASTQATGSTSITATLGGKFSSTLFTITAASLNSITISPANSSIALGLGENFSAIGNYSDGSTQDITTAVLWASSNSAIATVSNASGSQGSAASVATGSTSISATMAGISNTTILNVTSATLSSISISPLNPSIALGTAEPFVATGTYSDGTTQIVTTTVSWASSNAASATISNAGGTQGRASSASLGMTNISATLGGVSSSTVLTVISATLSSIAVLPSNPSVSSGTGQNFTAIGTYTDGTTQNITTSVTWASSNSGTASISNASGTQGNAATTASGLSTISATLGGVSSSTALTVTGGVTLVSIALTPAPSTEILLGSYKNIIATATYSDGSMADVTTSVTWSSSDSTIVSESNSSGTQGRASAVASGNATVTAMINSLSANIAIDIEPNPTFQLTAFLGSKTGPENNRNVPENLQERGTENLTNAQITHFSFSVQSGTSCSPVVNQALPMFIGNILSDQTVTANINVDFTGCDSTTILLLHLAVTTDQNTLSGVYRTAY